MSLLRMVDLPSPFRPLRTFTSGRKFQTMCLCPLHKLEISMRLIRSANFIMVVYPQGVWLLFETGKQVLAYRTRRKSLVQKRHGEGSNKTKDTHRLQQNIL